MNTESSLTKLTAVLEVIPKLPKTLLIIWMKNIFLSAARSIRSVFVYSDVTLHFVTFSNKFKTI